MYIFRPYATQTYSSEWSMILDHVHRMIHIQKPKRSTIRFEPARKIGANGRHSAGHRQENKNHHHRPSGHVGKSAGHLGKSAEALRKVEPGAVGPDFQQTVIS